MAGMFVEPGDHYELPGARWRRWKGWRRVDALLLFATGYGCAALIAGRHVGGARAVRARRTDLRRHRLHPQDPALMIDKKGN